MMTHDLIVIGAGPAGMAAATTAAGLGLKTLLLDEQKRPGGQIYRNVTAVNPKVAAWLGPDYAHGRKLAQALAASGAEQHHGTLVWDVTPELCVSTLQEGRVAQFKAPQLIAATGALERASPLPGWTLPGVMNAGAAQIALKAHAAVPSGAVVLAGAGPLLLLVACQLLDAGAQVVAVVETAAPGNRWLALNHLPQALGTPGPLFKGLRWLARLRRARVPWFKQATQLQALGEDRLQSLSFVAAGCSHDIKADTLLLHHGVVPDTQLSRLLRVQHHWSDQQLAWLPQVDDGGQTSLAGFRVAGDGAGIVGALAAEVSGTLAALGAAQALGRIAPAAQAALAARTAALHAALARQRRLRPFLDALYRPPRWLNTPADETLVCRCEEVSAGRVREMARLGCQGPNQTKFFSRCGMGPCQGRMCGLTVTQLLADELGKSPAEVGAYRIRAPLKPVPLSAIAALAETE